MGKYHNIEYRRNRAGYYIGYSGDGRSWRISGQSGNWNARANVTAQGSLNALLMYPRLSDISEELASIK